MIPYYIAAVLLFSVRPSVDAGPFPVAFVEKINGKVALATSDGVAIRTLDPKLDLGLILNSTDKLKCSQGASVTGVFVIGPELNKIVDLCRPRSNPSPSSTAAQGLSAEAAGKLRDYVLAGRSKGSETPIFNPPEGGAIIASSFIIEWQNRPPLNNFLALLRDGGKELAHAANVDGTTGRLDDPSFRQALMPLRDSPTSNHALKLTFKFENGAEKTSSFSVLTLDEEQRLAQELAKVSATGLFHFVERAAIYDSFHLYGLVPAEYAAALSDAPQSRDLLRAALAAYSRIGDLHHAREIRDQLQKIEEPDKN